MNRLYKHAQLLSSNEAAMISRDPVEMFYSLPPLETKRLLLRMVRLSDAHDFYEYASDSRVTQFVLWDAHRTMSDTRKHIRFMLRQYRNGEPSCYVIVLKSTGTMIGTIGFMAYSSENSCLEIGYSLSHAYWNQGYMTEALGALLNLSFAVMKVNRVEAVHDTENPASGRVMAKCGMRYEGTHRQRVKNKGRFIDVEMWAILRSDYESPLL